ncbi:hypothetical protein FACS1894158_13090 [Betaproteobacteria bacterium]|nr:hypothetical protein FACS1894158_13090 [Betaproteobacteria bacterium]
MNAKQLASAFPLPLSSLLHAPAATLGLVLLAFACAVPANAQEQAFLARHGLADKTVPQIIDYLDRLDQNRPLSFTASVTSTELKLGDGQNTYAYPLGEPFYLSIAPYISTTHPCFNHSLASCRAELANKTFAVTVKDAAGKVLREDKLTSYRNGFVGIWLPRNIGGTIEVKYNGLSASASFATKSDSQTCLTTLKLERK